MIPRTPGGQVVIVLATYLLKNQYFCSCMYVGAAPQHALTGMHVLLSTVGEGGGGGGGGGAV